MRIHVEIAQPGAALLELRSDSGALPPAANRRFVAAGSNTVVRGYRLSGDPERIIEVHAVLGVDVAIAVPVIHEFLLYPRKRGKGSASNPTPPDDGQDLRSVRATPAVSRGCRISEQS
jgi:hypothetical protein